VLRMELAKRLKSGGVCEKPKDGGHSSLDSGELRWCCLLFVGSVVIVVAGVLLFVVVVVVVLTFVAVVLLFVVTLHPLSHTPIASKVRQREHLPSALQRL